jgi:hypothetical protein
MQNGSRQHFAAAVNEYHVRHLGAKGRQNARFATGALLPCLSRDFDGNGFTGTVPSSITRLTGMKYLDLSRNAFDGKLPVGFTALSRLVIV